jgi:hypothetical protein
MDRPAEKKGTEEIKAERRRERWKAFLTPWITMGSIVASVAMIMALIKSCRDLQQMP